MAVNPIPPDLPDLVIHRILQLLPTKSAIRMSFLSKEWQDACCLGPVIDFNEGGDDNNLHEHTKFVENILNRYLEICEKDPNKRNLEKFKLHMTRYSSRDANIVTKWLIFSCKRSVKELDISLMPVSELNYDMLSCLDPLEASRAASRMKNLFYLSRMALVSLVNAKSVTTLNLEYVRMKKIYNKHPISVGLLPSLKSMSFKRLHFDYEALLSLISECPFIEHLSLTSCSFQGDIYMRSSSLKSLEIDRCEALLVRVYEAINLKSLSVVSGFGSSEFSQLEQVIFRDCLKLKCMNIHASHLRFLNLDGCHNVKGTIDAPKLEFFNFVGYLKCKFSLKAPNLRMTRIELIENWDREAATSNRQWKHFTTLSDFLQEFGISKSLYLCVSDFKAVIFPKDFRKTLSSPIFPNLEELHFSAKIPCLQVR
ncbi:putative F-box/LRR-repeat protein At4g15060 [Rosa chinensis]|nr:putative F-box/LRR-repeat protein At4g15060 [Rosa chinensis]